VWYVTPVTETGTLDTSSVCADYLDCACGSIENHDGDPCCGTSGAGCRQLYP
jgi:hypothetical protein